MKTKTTHKPNHLKTIVSSLTQNRFMATKNRRAATLLIATYILLAITYSTNIWIYEAPDEPGHIELIMNLINTKSLPVQSIEQPNYAHHPPLYYVLAALPASLADINDLSALPRINPNFVWPGQDTPAIAFHNTAETFPYNGRVLAIHLARAVSILSGIVTLLLTISIGWSLFPQQKEMGLLATAFVAFNPQFLFVTSTVNNDSLLIAASTGVIWQLLRTLRQPDAYREWILLGIGSALAILTKSTAAVLLNPRGPMLADMGSAAKKHSGSPFVKAPPLA